MRRQQPRNLVELISEHVRDMELERIRIQQEKYSEANHEAIQRQRNAKRSLVELEEKQEEMPRWSLTKSNGHRGSIENSFIGGWNDEEFEECGAKTSRPNTHAIRRRQYRPRIAQTENLVPQLKNLLRRLESPERKKEQSTQHQFSTQNFNIELVKDLANKRKHTVKVSDILKLQENWVSCPMSNANQQENSSVRPLRSANERLNLNSASTTRQTVYPFRMPSQEGSRHRLESLKEEQIIELIKRKRLEQSARKRPKEGGISTATANIMTTPRRQYSSMKRYNNQPRQKLTLINLLQ